jgi:hypothetical protein
LIHVPCMFQLAIAALAFAYSLHRRCSTRTRCAGAPTPPPHRPGGFLISSLIRRVASRSSYSAATHCSLIITPLHVSIYYVISVTQFGPVFDSTSMVKEISMHLCICCVKSRWAPNTLTGLAFKWRRLELLRASRFVYGSVEHCNVLLPGT